MLTHFSSTVRKVENKSGSGIARMPPHLKQTQVIQPKIGFEIEVLDVYVHRNYDQALESNIAVDVNELSLSPYGKGEVIMQGKGYTLEADTYEFYFPYLEIVTEPFDETAEGFEKMRQTFREIENLFESILAVTEKKEVFYPIINDRQFGTFAPHTENTVLEMPAGTIKGFMQVTAGLDLGAVSRLFENIRPISPSDREFRNYYRSYGQQAFLRLNLNPEHRDAEKAEHLAKAYKLSELYAEKYSLHEKTKGFLCLLFAYLMWGKLGSAIYPKVFTPVLAKTDFAAMFKLSPDYGRLSEASGELLKEIYGDFLQRSNLEPKEPLIQYVYGRKKAVHQQILKSLTREKWLAGILEGKDLLTEKHFPNRLRAYELESLGVLGAQTDDDGDVSGKPVFEFRRLPKVVFCEDWRPFAELLFQYFYALNHQIPAFLGKTVPI